MNASETAQPISTSEVSNQEKIPETPQDEIPSPKHQAENEAIVENGFAIDPDTATRVVAPIVAINSDLDENVSTETVVVRNDVFTEPSNGNPLEESQNSVPKKETGMHLDPVKEGSAGTDPKTNSVPIPSDFVVVSSEDEKNTNPNEEAEKRTISVKAVTFRGEAEANAEKASEIRSMSANEPSPTDLRTSFRGVSARVFGSSGNLKGVRSKTDPSSGSSSSGPSTPKQTSRPKTSIAGVRSMSAAEGLPSLEKDSEPPLLGSRITSRLFRNANSEDQTFPESSAPIMRNDMLSFQDRQQSMKLHVSREPVIIRSSLLRGWHRDIVALLHNMLRLEVKDLYRILDSMGKRSLFLSVRDFASFFEWWWLFKRLVLQALIVEEEVLFGFIGDFDSTTEELSAEHRENRRSRLVTLMNEVDVLGDQFIAGLVGLDEQDLFQRSERVAISVLKHISKMDASIPPLIANTGKLTDTNRIQVEKDLMRAITRSPTQEALFFVLRGNGLSEKSWPVARLRPHNLMLCMMRRKRYERHLTIVKSFSEQLKLYDISMMKAHRPSRVLKAAVPTRTVTSNGKTDRAFDRNQTV
eukprot:CAMPEP_0182445694 /NCGR_PEP_ID=MMETSP1172-20130603/3732_1 /TAXON_ID=708627 /ORGANISM="Timspurckia oligopyrenoides, Strain CCMP3278" /LENGTH=582 /DNA_ID=CAMNT_0024641509 /DNA_START=512 /DNA_END=2260 /DNA_ORIENTATION=+